jgi:N6-adenosine-specific RNA methylase IME4
MGSQWDSVIEAARGKHSEKPDAVYELIEAYFPNVPKIELNARTAREGWESWGFEAPEAA